MADFDSIFSYGSGQSQDTRFKIFMKAWMSKITHIFVLGRKPVSSAYKETFQERNKDLHLICRRQTVVTIAALKYFIITISEIAFFWEISWQNRRINNLQCWIMKEKDKPKKKVFSWGVSVSQTKFPTVLSSAMLPAPQPDLHSKPEFFTEIRNMSP